MAKPLRSCVIYCRISLDKMDEAGVERQETECRELAARLGLEVLFVYVDNSISAYSGKTRPQFEALLEARPAIVIVWHIDRLVVLNRDLERVIEVGATVHAVKSGHIDLSNSAGRATARTIVAWAHYERELKGERQKAMLRQRKAAGKTWWPTRPFGYETSGVLRADEAAVMGMVYRGFAEGDRNLAGWARWLNDGGWTTTGKARQWSSGTVRDHLLAERNLGGPSWAQLIDEETWTTVRDALHARNRQGSVSEIGMLAGKSGVGRCGVCDVHIMTAKNRFGVQVYRCAAAGHVSWPKDAVDEIVSAVVAAVIAKNREKIQTAAKVPGGDEDNVALRRLMEDHLAGRISAEEFVAAGKREQDRRSRRAAKPMVFRDWDELDLMQRRAAIDVLIEAIRLPSRGQGRGGVDPDVVLDSIQWR